MSGLKLKFKIVWKMHISKKLFSISDMFDSKLLCKDDLKNISAVKIGQGSVACFYEVSVKDYVDGKTVLNKYLIFLSKKKNSTNNFIDC
jgi:hypothetical protein